MNRTPTNSISNRSSRFASRILPDRISGSAGCASCFLLQRARLPEDDILAYLSRQSARPIEPKKEAGGQAPCVVPRDLLPLHGLALVSFFDYVPIPEPM